MAATFSSSSREERRRETDVQATAQAKGLPMKVGPCMNTPGFPQEIVWATSCVVKVAAIVMYPPALPMHMMSGVTPACSCMNSFPVRPNPVAISSKMSSRLYRSHSCLASEGIAGDIEPHATGSLHDGFEDKCRQFFVMGFYGFPKRSDTGGIPFAVESAGGDGTK